MWFIGVEVEQETSAPPPKENPGSAPVNALKKSNKQSTPRRKQLSTRDQIRGKSVVWYGYPTHAHNHINRAVAAMNSCFTSLRSWRYCVVVE